MVMRWLKERSPLPTNSVLLINASLPLPTIPLHPTICYRCTPTQKEVVIKSVKSQTDELTLAIGDGSNDVNMITTAHVGIGIKGKEGNEVCRVSDFVLGQFSLLSPLILYYGR
jgi:P-type E1-E2 ATPase